jgi:hypothetical protein
MIFLSATGIQRIVGPGPGICNGSSMWNNFVQVCYGNALRLYTLRFLWEFSRLEVLTDGFLPTYLLDMKKGVTLHSPPGRRTDAAGRT